MRGDRRFWRSQIVVGAGYSSYGVISGSTLSPWDNTEVETGHFI